MAEEDKFQPSVDKFLLQQLAAKAYKHSALIGLAIVLKDSTSDLLLYQFYTNNRTHSAKVDVRVNLFLKCCLVKKCKLKL